MARRTLNIGLGVALVVSIALNVAAWLPRTRPTFEYVPNMVRTARYNTFEANPNFPDGMTLRAPVPGTIFRGFSPPPTGNETNPFSADDRAAVERGATVFTNFCQPCHGATGQGDGLVVMRGFPPPPPIYRGQTQRMRDAQMFGQLTNGQNAMPPYALQLSREDRWKAILYVRTLRLPAPPPEAGSAQ
ncbi:MAG: hypothetical protein A3G76_00595 [Acidobacteria bacterium RIFCSPLOWO2_12_FULL_65_11]|nr:MAG: hypothetical protein A3H95_06870 [Acidobacteria bacterium RIFCSPLOWO2_02_FULL_64_15]OFW34161.1 MAG: hypothetical protein A3G76_00595 [Acidobacteria bacterium RIFCSPLOWO2_12_FULL_65_11]